MGLSRGEMRTAVTVFVVGGVLCLLWLVFAPEAEERVALHRLRADLGQLAQRYQGTVYSDASIRMNDEGDAIYLTGDPAWRQEQNSRLEVTTIRLCEEFSDLRKKKGVKGDRCTAVIVDNSGTTMAEYDSSVGEVYRP